MDPMVSARVPLEVRNQVNKGLKDIGSSPTELINCAYVFFLENKELPQVRKVPQPGVRTLSKDQLKELKAKIKCSTLPTSRTAQMGKTDKELLQERLIEQYESLA